MRTLLAFGVGHRKEAAHMHLDLAQRWEVEDERLWQLDSSVKLTR
jgi:hypothetical protein|tara:strand:+ start:354 stop:488 length:135 start_codon:yes stop_codon:yes gene_type:complete